MSAHSVNFSDTFQLNIQASAAIVQIISHDTLRIHAYCVDAAENLNKNLFIWNNSFGLKQYQFETGTWSEHDDLSQPQEVLEWMLEADNHDEEFIILLEDFHHYLHEHTLISRLRTFAVNVASQKINGVTIVMSQPTVLLPPELEKDIQVMHMPLPDADDLKKLMIQARQRYDIHERDFQESPALIDAALGLSTSEAQLAFAKAACKYQSLTENQIPFIVKEKEQVIRKSGHLEYFHPKATLDDVGGLDNLKSWLKRRKQSFGADAREFGLETPRGVLLLGIPGTGKSLAAKAVANAWQLPLLRLDMGKIYGGIVGQSEANIRSALQTAEALAPSILWVDEIEKGMSGMQSSGATDGGTTSRVLGTFLTWLQEKEKPVFVVATANHIAQLPPELLRKGRVDEIFFVDLPTEQDRKDIIAIHLKRRKRLDDFSPEELDELARASNGFTGAELEEAVKEAMFLAFDAGHQLNKQDILHAIQATSPLSQTMHEMITDTREWAKGRAVSASSQPPEQLTTQNKEKPRLKQEGENPFIKK